MLIKQASELQELMAAMLEAAGTPAAPAAFVAESLVDANLAGHDSHGVIRILQYVEEVEKGKLDPASHPELVSRSGATAIIDARWGWGQPAMTLATDEAIALAIDFGIGIAATRNCYHIGRVAPYVERIARQGMVGLAMANAGRAVAPYGGSSRVMGTNPVAWAVTTGSDNDPVSLDIATAYVAEGKLRVARSKGAEAPAGAVLTTEGLPSVDPNDFYDGGALVAFGAHKGSGFSLLAQLLGAGLAGMTQENLANRRGANGPVVIAIDPGRFIPIDQFVSVVSDESARVRDANPAVGFDKVSMPGDPELAERQRRLAGGVPVPEPVWNDLVAAARKQGIAVPVPV